MREPGCQQASTTRETAGASSVRHADRTVRDAIGAVLLFELSAIPLAHVFAAAFEPQTAGVAAGTVIVGAVSASLLRRVPAFSTPADRVTLLRAVLAGLVAVLVVEGLFTGHHAPVPVLLLGALAVLLDGVDGAVARRTQTANAAGARLDSATDAALVLILSLAAADVVGAWTVCVGGAYYIFVAAGHVWPSLLCTPPRSVLRKAIGAAQPFVLLLALTPVPQAITVPAVAVALALLTFSFGRDAFTLARRQGGQHRGSGCMGRQGRQRPGRGGSRWTATPGGAGVQKSQYDGDDPQGGCQH